MLHSLKGEEGLTGASAEHGSGNEVLEFACTRSRGNSRTCSLHAPKIDLLCHETYTPVSLTLQEAYQMAREADPDSSRTLGILTKPDMIEKGTHEDWLSIMRGEQFSLKLVRFHLSASVCLT